MKNVLLRVILFSSLLFYTSCNKEVSEKDFDKVEWLLGQWNRTNVKEGRSAHERWEKVSDQELRGWGVSLDGKDTSFVEKLRIVSKDEILYYVADVAENPEPVYFKFTSISDQGFTCENPEHDFPKKIQYVLLGDSLKATASDDGNENSFTFVRSR